MPGAPAAGFFLLQHRQQSAQCGGAVAGHADLHRVPQAQPGGVEVDLHAARGAGLGQELAVREGGAHHEKRVALLHHVPGGRGAQQADAAGHPGDVVGQHRLAEQRLGAAGLQTVGDGDHLVRGAERAGAHQHGHFLARVQHRGRFPQACLIRRLGRVGVAHAGMRGAVRHRRVLVGQLLQIVRDDHAGDAAGGGRDAHGAVDQMAYLLRHHRCCHELACHVLEQCLQVHFLLVMRAYRGARLLADDGDHGNMVHLGVIQAVQQVDGARAGRGVAEPDLAGELRVRGGHERRHFLVPHLNVLHLGAGAFERHVQTADAVTRVAIHTLQAPFVEAMPDEIADVHAHPVSLQACTASCLATHRRLRRSSGTLICVQGTAGAPPSQKAGKAFFFARKRQKTLAPPLLNIAQRIGRFTVAANAGEQRSFGPFCKKNCSLPIRCPVPQLTKRRRSRPIASASAEAKDGGASC